MLRELSVRNVRLLRGTPRENLAPILARAFEGFTKMREIAFRYMGPLHPDGGGGAEPPSAMWDEMQEELPPYMPWYEGEAAPREIDEPPRPAG